MKNIHVLPTDKPSRLILQTNNELRLSVFSFKGAIASGITQNIYITNDENIKEGEYYIHGERLHKHLGKKCLDVLTDKEYTQSSLINKDSVFKKIILTIDQDLIKDGVQAIDDEFLEWFVKNPSCDFVKVEVDLSKHNGQFQTKYGYKIIISKKEPKQETIEEAAEKYPYCYASYGSQRKAFIDGAKWQQERSYSKQDMIEFAYKYIDERRDQGARAMTPELLIKQFKKK